MLYLMRYYEPGDAIFLFGFSRGAYTVRVLADIILKIGILREGNGNLMPYAFEMYFNRNKKFDQKTIDGFSDAFCNRPESIKCIGVFDTVASLGWLLRENYRSLSGELHPRVENALHAVSIDEKRNKFPVSLFKQRDDAPKDQNLQQVWFAGVHSDVGGYYKERGLSDITLEWMLLNAARYGLHLDRAAKQGLGPDPMIKLHKSRTGFWKLLPLAHRKIPEEAAIHPSVLERRDNPKVGYAPKLPDNYTRVDTPDWPPGFT